MFLKKILLTCALCCFVASTTPMPKISPMANDYDYAYYVDDLKNINACHAVLIIGGLIIVPLLLDALYLKYCSPQDDTIDPAFEILRGQIRSSALADVLRECSN